MSSSILKRTSGIFESGGFRLSWRSTSTLIQPLSWSMVGGTMERRATLRLAFLPSVCMSFALLRRLMPSASSACVKPTLVRFFAMPRSKALVDAAGEVREIMTADLRSFRAAADVLPASLQRKVGVRGAQKAPVKERITIRLSPEVVQRFRSTGAGWQTRVDAALQDWLKTHQPAKGLR